MLREVVRVWSCKTEYRLACVRGRREAEKERGRKETRERETRRGGTEGWLTSGYPAPTSTLRNVRVRSSLLKVVRVDNERENLQRHNATRSARTKRSPPVVSRRTHLSTSLPRSLSSTSNSFFCPNLKYSGLESDTCSSSSFCSSPFRLSISSFPARSFSGGGSMRECRGGSSDRA